MGKIRELVSDDACGSCPAKRDVPGAVTSVGPAIRAGAAAVIVALAVGDLLVDPGLGAGDHLGTGDRTLSGGSDR